MTLTYDLKFAPPVTHVQSCVFSGYELNVLSFQFRAIEARDRRYRDRQMAGVQRFGQLIAGTMHIEIIITN